MGELKSRGAEIRPSATMDGIALHRMEVFWLCPIQLAPCQPLTMPRIGMIPNNIPDGRNCPLGSRLSSFDGGKQC